MKLEQQLRDALQRDAAELEPVGPGPDDARRRAFRNKRRAQSGVLVLSAVALAGGTLAFVESRPADNGTRVQSQVTAPTADLAWRSVDGTVAFASTHFTTAAGVTYALSTAPGKQPADATNVPEALYSTRDGVTWSNASLSTPHVADVAESNGVLYALSTGPGAQPGSTDYRLATSSDGGAKWDDSLVPVQLTPPAATVPVATATRVQVARRGTTTVVMAEASFSPDYAKQVPISDAQGFRETATGVEVTDSSACRSVKAGVSSDPVANSQDVVKVRMAARAAGKCDPTVVATHPWSEFGLSGPAALRRQVAVVNTGDGSWHPTDVAADPNTTVQDVTATSNGFLMTENTWGDASGRSSTKLLASADGRTWAPLPTAVPASDSISIAGDRIIAVDSATSVINVSSDAGATWIATSDIASLVPESDPFSAYGPSIDAGPLGFAVVVTSGTDRQDPHPYLLHSADGVSWKVTDLAKVGAPAKAFVQSVIVGADHIEVAFGTGDPARIVTLVATPKA